MTCSRLCARWRLHRRTAVSHTPISFQGKTVSFSALCVAYFRLFSSLHTLTVLSGPFCCTNCDSATTAAANLHVPRRGQPLVLSSRKQLAFSVASVALLYFPTAGTAAFQSRGSRISLRFCATTSFSDPSPISISHSRYPTLERDAFESIISSNIGSPPN